MLCEQTICLAMKNLMMYTKSGGTASKHIFLWTNIAVDKIFHPVCHFCQAENIKLRAKFFLGNTSVSKSCPISALLQLFRL